MILSKLSLQDLYGHKRRPLIEMALVTFIMVMAYKEKFHLQVRTSFQGEQVGLPILNDVEIAQLQTQTQILFFVLLFVL